VPGAGRCRALPGTSQPRATCEVKLDLPSPQIDAAAGEVPQIEASKARQIAVFLHKALVRLPFGPCGTKLALRPSGARKTITKMWESPLLIRRSHLLSLLACALLVTSSCAQTPGCPTAAAPAPPAPTAPILISADKLSAGDTATTKGASLRARMSGQVLALA
jgi:hypothetical protein